MLRVLACVTETHDPRLVVLAALICLFACLTAFSLVSRARSAASSQSRALWAAAAAALFAVAICGLHFTAMAAVSLDPSAMIPLPDALASPEWLAVAVTAVTLMIIVLSLAGSLVDQHLAERKASEAERLRRYVTE